MSGIGMSGIGMSDAYINPDPDPNMQGISQALFEDMLRRQQTQTDFYAQANAYGPRPAVERISPAEIALMRATAVDAHPLGRNRYAVPDANGITEVA